MQKKQTVIVMGAIDSTLGKLNNATLGQALGFFMTELQYDRVRGKPMLGNLMAEIQALMTQPHFPNIDHVVRDLMSDGWAGPVFKGSVMAAIAGWILAEIDMHPTVSRIGDTLKTLGSNAALGTAAVVLLDDSSLGYSDGAPGQPYGGHNGYPRGASYSPLGRRNGGYFTMPNVSPGTPSFGGALPASPKPS